MNEKYHILIAEDDKDIQEVLRIYLENEGFKLYVADDGKAALKLLEANRIDMALIDIMMPKMNGYELIKVISKQFNMPILVMSAKNQDSDKILGLNLGADDYLPKPFNPLELVARVKASLRRFYQLNARVSNDKSSSNVVVGDLELNMDTMSLFKKGKEISLTPTEFKILEMLMRKPGHVYTKVQISEKVNGAFYESDDSTMMVHISKIREKIEEDTKNPEYLKTIRGLGYKIEKK